MSRIVGLRTDEINRVRVQTFDVDVRVMGKPIVPDVRNHLAVFPWRSKLSRANDLSVRYTRSAQCTVGVCPFPPVDVLPLQEKLSPSPIQAQVPAPLIPSIFPVPPITR